ncbi:unnamed protein product [Cuscuta campestris]|uniref:Retrotransposon gag domain-containing protein n=1 Tax=Cuscuta campestris TaxID=132261 RepID=A0A484LWN0_9ASTE|nr:unnamed protein product [Cuscuta campestris]
MFRKGAYDWWKRIDQDPHTPKPWTWDRFDRAFTKEYVPTRYREERRDEFVALKQEGMSLPELRQRFDYLSQYATSLVSTPEDRLNEFVKKLRPDLRPFAALITTTDFNAAYDLIVKTEKSLDDLQATKKEDRATKDPRPAASTGPSGKSFGFGGKRYEKGSSSTPPPKRSKSRPSPSAAASNSNRTRSHPQCVHCGHFRKHCPTNPSSEPVLPRAPDQPAASHPARSQQSTAANNQQRARPQQSGRAPACTYAMHGRTYPSPDVILGTFILFDSVMHALIDPGSTLSYICVGMLANSAIVRSDLEIPTVVSNPLGHSMRLHHIYHRSPLSAQGKQFPADVIELPHKEFDIILGMDWLTEHRAVVDCSCRTVRLRAEDGPAPPTTVPNLRAAVVAVQLEQPAAGVALPQPVAAAVSFPSLAAIIADGCSAATPNGGRRQTPDAAVSPSPESRAAVARASSRSPSFQPPSTFAQQPPAAVDCSAASRCSSPSNCRSATVAGVRHHRRIRPLPRVDIAGRLTPTPD